MTLVFLLIGCRSGVVAPSGALGPTSSDRLEGRTVQARLDGVAPVAYSNRTMSSRAALLAIVLAGWAVTACAKQPMRIVGSSGRPNDMSFLVTMHEGDKLESYVIACARAPDGALSACRQLPVVLEGD